MTSSGQRSPRGLVLSVALAFVAGFVDTCGFVALFVMTGNVTQVVMDCVDYGFFRSAQTRSGTRARLAKFGPPVLGFAAGAVGGAVLFGRVGFWCLLLPVAIIGGLLLRRTDGETPSSVKYEETKA